MYSSRGPICDIHNIEVLKNATKEDLKDLLNLFNEDKCVCSIVK